MKYSHKFKGKDQYKNKQDNLLEPTRMFLYGKYVKKNENPCKPTINKISYQTCLDTIFKK